MATESEILTTMLSKVPDYYDKNAGSFIYDSLAPVAKQLASLDDSLVNVKLKLSAENLNGQELTQRVKEITGLERKRATFATGLATLIGTGTVNTGDLFETEGGIQFQATETKAITNSGTVAIRAVVAGSVGNVAAGAISFFPVTLSGFTVVSNLAPTSGGFDEETDDDLRKRYYEKLRSPATSGNKAHYRAWAKEVAGVGDAKVIPLWNGANTVRVIIIDSDRKPASPSLVASVQNRIDPDSSGLGEGEAPIGAFATVVSATGLNINVTATVVLVDGYTLASVKDNIEANIQKLLREIAFVESFVSYARVGAAILESEGVADYSGLTINGGTANVTIGNEEVAVLGAVNIGT